MMAEKQKATVAERYELPEARSADCDVAALARGRLTTSRYLTLRRISCRQDADALELRGQVPSFYLKQLAQEVVRKVAQGKRIVNLLEVRWNTR